MNISLTQAMIVAAAQATAFDRLNELEDRNASISVDDTTATISIKNSEKVQSVVVKRVDHGIDNYTFSGSISGFSNHELKRFCHKLVKQMRAKYRAYGYSEELARSKKKQQRILKEEKKEEKKVKKEEKKRKKKEKAKEKSHKRKKRRRREESPPPPRMRPPRPKVEIEGDIHFENGEWKGGVKGRVEHNPNPFQ